MKNGKQSQHDGADLQSRPQDSSYFITVNDIMDMSAINLQRDSLSPLGYTLWQMTPRQIYNMYEELQQVNPALFKVVNKEGYVINSTDASTSEMLKYINQLNADEYDPKFNGGESPEYIVLHATTIALRSRVRKLTATELSRMGGYAMWDSIPLIMQPIDLGFYNLFHLIVALHKHGFTPSLWNTPMSYTVARTVVLKLQQSVPDRIPFNWITWAQNNFPFLTGLTVGSMSPYASNAMPQVVAKCVNLHHKDGSWVINGHLQASTFLREYLKSRFAREGSEIEIKFNSVNDPIRSTTKLPFLESIRWAVEYLIGPTNWSYKKLARVLFLHRGESAAFMRVIFVAFVMGMLSSLVLMLLLSVLSATIFGLH